MHLRRRPENRRHPSIEALLNASADTDDPEAAICRRVRDLLANLEVLGWEGPPFQIEEVASYLGYLVEYVDGLSQDACIVSGPPARILVSTQVARVRQRFSLAHEIVHTLFPDHGMVGQPAGWVYAFDAQSPVEQLCQIGASELLMPLASFRAAVFQEEIGWDLIARVAADFEVSLEAAARRLVRLSDRKLCLLAARMEHKPSERAASVQGCLPGLGVEPPPQKLRVFTSVVGERAKDSFIPRSKSLPEQSVAYRAWSAAVAGELSMLSADEDWSGIGQLGWCRVHAAPVGAAPGEAPLVLCLLDLDPA